MPLYLLDTDVLIDFLRGRSDARAVLARFEGADHAVISVVSVAEIGAGIKAGEEAGTGRLLAALGKIPVSENIALAGGEILRSYQRSHGVELADALIAATAIEIDAVLITRNVKHYPEPAIKLQRPY